jgi:hypothetical protein
LKTTSGKISLGRRKSKYYFRLLYATHWFAQLCDVGSDYLDAFVAAELTIDVRREFSVQVRAAYPNCLKVFVFQWEG